MTTKQQLTREEASAKERDKKEKEKIHVGVMLNQKSSLRMIVKISGRSVVSADVSTASGQDKEFAQC